MKFLTTAFALVYFTSGGFPAQGSNIVDLSATSGQYGNFPSQDSTMSTRLFIRPFHLDIVPPSSGVQFYNKGIIFLSHSKIEEKVPENHLSFGSLKTFLAVPLDTVPGDRSPVFSSAPNVFPSEATTFTEDFNTMYFSLIPERDSREKIFRATLKSNDWVFDETPLEFCIGNYIYSHPTVAANGEFMIFSSDMDGTTGGLDLFISRKEGNIWGNPENIGKHINSAGNELFASLDAENNLYFSSDSIPGEGGYDVFVCRFNGKGWDQPNNLPTIINSRDDEVSFTVSRSARNRAFYTTRTRFGKSRTLLNSVTLPPSSLKDKNIDISLELIAMSGIDNKYPNTVKEVLESNAYNVSAKTTDQNPPLPKKITINTKPVAARNIPDDKKIEPPVEKPTTVATTKGTLAGTKETTPAAMPTKSVTAKNMADKNEDTLPTAKTTPATKVKYTADEQKLTSTPSNTAPVVPTEAKKDFVIYRVQILANTRPIGSKNFTVDGENYKSFEYLYMGGYRTCIGECKKLAEATVLQNACRRNGYSQAFVVAFKNNVRSTDPELFR